MSRDERTTTPALTTRMGRRNATALTAVATSAVTAAVAAAAVVLVTVLPPAAATTYNDGSMAYSAQNAGARASGASINRQDRGAVAAAYQSWWLPARAVTANQWNGSIDGCNAGTLAPGYLTAALDRVNYLRAQAGVPAVTANSVSNDRAQRAALIMEANGTNNHNPPTTATCYSPEGAEGARFSQLALNSGESWAEHLMDDFGPSNTSVSHRIGYLDPSMTSVGFGQTARSHATFTVDADPDGSLSRYPQPGVAWPTAGFFPAPLLPGISKRWSFSTYGVGFNELSEAQVSMTRIAPSASLPVDVTIEHRDLTTVVFKPEGITAPTQGEADVTYRIRISNVRTFDGQSAPDITYTTTLIDPSSTGTASIIWSAEPTISGTPRVGATLTGSPGTYAPSSSADQVSYAWSRGGTAVGTGRTYTPTTADTGSRLTLTVFVTNGATTGTREVTSGTISDAAGPANTTPPVLTGTPEVGQTLTVDPGTWTPEPSSYAYAWYRGTTLIEGAEAATYTVTAGDAGLEVRALVTAVDVEDRIGSASSNAIRIWGASEPGPTNISPPQTSGTFRVGSIVTTNNGAWSGDPYGYAYQWMRNGQPITGATANTYTLRADDHTGIISVRVLATNTDGTRAATSSGSGPVALGLAPTTADRLTATGRPLVGQTLEASVLRWTPAVDSVRYQWYRGATKIRGATQRTYRVVKADAGQRLSVRVVARKSGYTSARRTSPSTAQIDRAGVQK